jgi:predicted Ser/Thr protein kinase
MNDLFQKYYNSFHSKYGIEIQAKIKECFGKKSFQEEHSSSSSSTFSIKHKQTHSDFHKFIYYYISRHILIYELKRDFGNSIFELPHISQLHKHIQNASYFTPLEHYERNENTNYYKINDTTMIKIVDLSAQEVFDKDIEIPSFRSEVEIAKIAQSLEIGPRIINTQIYIDTSNANAYGILYLSYVNGENLQEYLKRNPKERSKVRSRLEKLFMKLYSKKITTISPTRRDIPVNIMISKDGSTIWIIDYTFGQTIQKYVYERNHSRIRTLYPYSRQNQYHLCIRYCMNYFNNFYQNQSNKSNKSLHP